VIAHFHYVLFGVIVFATYAGVYFWFPKMTGRLLDERLAKVHFWLTMIGFNLTFFPQHFLGLAGMPRRIPDYALQFTPFNQWSTTGAFLTIGAQLIFFYVAIQAMKSGAKASNQVWEGADGLEWTLPSPAPYHTFSTPPRIK
jgi:cytochrome c oxidase subunit 1